MGILKKLAVGSIAALAAWKVAEATKAGKQTKSTAKAALKSAETTAETVVAEAEKTVKKTAKKAVAGVKKRAPSKRRTAAAT